MAGRFLTVEGGEGVGKSTFLRALAAELSGTKALRIVHTFEPGGTPLSNRFREIFKDPSPDERMFVETEFLTVSAARAQHVRQLIKPALDDDLWVVCDRFTDSSVVYQGLLGGVPQKQVNFINDFATDGLTPDLTLLLDCPANVSLRRLAGRKGTENTEVARFDSQPLAYHEKIREGFLKQAKDNPERFVILDAQQSTADSVAACLTVFEQKGWI